MVLYIFRGQNLPPLVTELFSSISAQSSLGFQSLPDNHYAHQAKPVSPNKFCLARWKPPRLLFVLKHYSIPYEDNIRTSIIILGNIKMRVNRLNPVQKATYLNKNEKWEIMKNVQ